MKSKLSIVLVVSAVAALFALSGGVRAQFVGGTLGATTLSPLYGDTTNQPRPKSGEQRRRERLTKSRIAKLKPIRRIAEQAERKAMGAAKAKSVRQRRDRLASAVRRIQFAKKRLDKLSARYSGDKTFKVEADRFAFQVRKQLSRFRRSLKEVELDVEAGRVAKLDLSLIHI